MRVWARILALSALVALAGCASTVDLREAYRTGYVDGVRDTVAVVKKSEERLLAKGVYRKVVVPDSVVGGTYIPAHNEVIYSPAGVEYAFTPAEADKLGKAFMELGTSSKGGSR